MRNSKGFTLIELLVVIAIIGLLASITVVATKEAIERVHSVRARHEINSIGTAMELFLMDNNYEYPCDVNRNLPSGIEEYLSTNPEWPKAPWPGSVYDWDYWHPDPESTGGCAGRLVDTSAPGYPPDEPVYQITIRFCEYGKPETCRFPDEPWVTKDWYDDPLNSAVYWCISGPCRAHGSYDYDHPGCCMSGACPLYAPRCE